MANTTEGAMRRSTEETRRIFEDAFMQGMTVEAACKLAGRSESWYDNQRRKDLVWKEKINRIRRVVRGIDPGEAVPDFPEFCEKYLGMKLWPHQLAMFDVLEGREPRWMPPGLMYQPGTMGHRRVLINVPPNHAKSMTVSISYVLWRLLKDKSMTVLIISKTQGFAAKILWAIKQRLTSPRYAELQVQFGPVGGFKATADQWSNTKVYLWGDERDSQEKDPTLEAVGIGGQIYGNRAKLVLIDDAIVLSNAVGWEAQQDWIRQEVASRIGPDDQIAVVGTRVAPIDLYRELLNPDHYHDQQVPWTVLRMPAVLEYGEKNEEWVTLWPKSDMPFSDTDEPGPDGLYDRWTGARLARVRNEVGPRRWSLVYQQADVADESTFDQVCVRGSIDGLRGAGAMPTVGVPGGPDSNWQPYTILGVDPAIKGVAAFCCYVVDRVSGRRWVIDMKGLRAPTPEQIRNQIISMAEKYRPNEVRVEANAYQLAIVQDKALMQWMASNGIPLKPHLTYANKTDPLYGVAAMSQLFGSARVEGHKRVHNKDNLISLPNTAVPGIKVLIDELVAWSPTTPTRNLRQDHLMALWICETRALELVRTADRKPFAQQNKFMSRNRRDSRMVVNLSDLAAAGATGHFL